MYARQPGRVATHLIRVACQTALGVRPDLWTFGQIIGGGLPVGAFGGSREVMGADFSVLGRKFADNGEPRSRAS